jgi:hypothetical protein
MIEDRTDTLLVLVRAAELSWPVAKAILEMRARDRARPDADFARLLAAFEKVTIETAKQIVEFYRQRRLGRRANTD